MRIRANAAWAWACLMVVAFEARATQPYTGDSFRLTNVTPADGATGIPLNTRVRVELKGGYLPPDESTLAAGDLAQVLQRAQLRDDGGQMVDADAVIHVTKLTIDEYDPSRSVDKRWLLELTPRTALRPATRYQLFLELKQGDYQTVSYRTEAQRVAAFTTGREFDVTAPTFAGVEKASPLQLTSEDPFYSDVFRFTQAWFRLLLGPAVDGSGPAAYNVYAVDTKGGEVPLLRAWQPKVAGAGTNELVVGNFCHFKVNIMWHTPMDLVMPTGESTYVVRAVDIAGNEEKNQRRITVDLSCDGSRVGNEEPRVEPSPDPAVPATSEDVHQAPGCGVARAPAPGGGLALLLVLPLAFLLRRRRW